MRPAALLSLIGLILFPAAVLADETCGTRKVAFSFDDSPTSDTAVMSGAERTERIIAALDEGGVTQAMFFSLGSAANTEAEKRLVLYADAGHVIANHSNSHPNLHAVGAEAFATDVRAGHAALKGMPGFKPYFRFPYLNEGRSIEERDAIRRALDELGYDQGYVTIDNFDFFIDRLFRDATEQKQSMNMDAVRDLYVETILAAARHYDGVACTWLGRSPHHVLLLHENDVAALFLGALIEAFKEEGWAIIEAEAAYEDPMASAAPDTLFLGQGRVAALAAIAGAEEESLRHAGENYDVLRAAFAKTLKNEE